MRVLWGRAAAAGGKTQRRYRTNTAKTQQKRSTHAANIQQKYSNIQQKYSKVLQNAIVWCEEGEERRPPPPSHRCVGGETPGCASPPVKMKAVPRRGGARSAPRSTPPRGGDAARSPRTRGRDGRQVYTPPVRSRTCRHKALKNTRKP